MTGGGAATAHFNADEYARQIEHGVEVEADSRKLAPAWIQGWERNGRVGGRLGRSRWGECAPGASPRVGSGRIMEAPIPT